MNSSIPLNRMLAWVSDITYIWTFDGFVYLTSIMDLYSQKIIAWVLELKHWKHPMWWNVSESKKIRRIAHPLIIHTDRGCRVCIG